MEVRDFQPEHFARFHPGGSLGRRLLSRVENEMVSDNLPFIDGDAGILDLIETMSRGALGICMINGSEFGIVTDGDIRRAIGTYGDSIFSISASNIMTLNPNSVEIGTRMEDALTLMDLRQITTLIIKDTGRVVGILKK
jgi:arabinose-5-phosphate isomerase